ncbi:hypothetical protein P5673_005153 [Acropora cervicornis]|uniref:Uncharacterized protein n=1 Tax=Acropora cervicornis TaxID=6130 RepID=A0AAD9QZH6_ACRCE|nr:hypothetical protein P5673_005153 [Acropora cervicornis]
MPAASTCAVYFLPSEDLGRFSIYTPVAVTRLKILDVRSGTCLNLGKCCLSQTTVGGAYRLKNEEFKITEFCNKGSI